MPAFWEHLVLAPLPKSDGEHIDPTQVESIWINHALKSPLKSFREICQSKRSRQGRKSQPKLLCCLASSAAMRWTSLEEEVAALAALEHTWKVLMELSNCLCSLVTSVLISQHNLVIWGGTSKQNMKESDSSATSVKNHSLSSMSFHVMSKANTRGQHFPARSANMRHLEWLFWETTSG